MQIKYACIFIFFFILLIINSVFPKSIFSQSCSEYVRIDIYRCDFDPNPETGECGEVIYDYIDTKVRCVWDNETKSCLSLWGICSSNDSCVKNNGKCFCTASVVDCNIIGGGTPPPGGCTTTTPSITSIQWGVPNANKVTINFNGGVGGNRNDIAFGKNKGNVDTKCAFSTVGCVSDLNVTSPLIVNKNLFATGTVYYFKVWNIAGSCTKSSNIKQDISSCEISPNTMNFGIGGPSQLLTSEVVSTNVWLSSPTDVKVTFNTSPTGIASVSPASETNSYPYRTSVSPVSVGTTNASSNVYLDNVLSCTATNPTVVNVTSNTPSCTLSLSPSNLIRTEGASPVTFTATVTPVNGSVESVRFTSSNTNAATVTTPDNSGPTYTTTATIANNVNSQQVTTITAYARVGGVVDLCYDTSILTVNDSIPSNSPWWQVVDGDVTTEEDIISEVPSDNVFIADGAGGFPGVPVYGTSLDTVSGGISSLSWNANTLTSQPRIWEDAYFEALIPDAVVGNGDTYDGYEWNIISNPTATLNTTNFGNRKVIYFIDGNLNIDGNITLDNGVGFFVAFVSGNITINPNVTNIEGMYLTDGTFNTSGTIAFNGRGSFVAYSGFNINRDLVNDINPSEIFEFAPDQILLFPPNLMFKRTKWTEVAP